MTRFFSAILAILLVLPAISQTFTVAAQEIHQQEKSGAALSDPTPAAPVQDPQPGSIQIPDGTPIDIESPYTLNSMDFKANDRISFHVVNPIKLNGVIVVAAGAVATGRVDRAKRGGHFGKAGLFVWTMQSVTAVDGSQIPLRVAPVRLRGDSKGATVATQMIITGALLPLIAPVALLHGFKRGKDAFIPAGKRYSVYVEGNATIEIATSK